MNDRFQKINYSVLVTLKHKGRCTKVNNPNEQTLNKLLKFHCISYIKNTKVYLTYKNNKCSIPNLNKNYKFLY